MLEAMAIYRQRLLKDACYQWLTTADSLSHFRTVMAARHQTKTALDNFQLVQRCALHWKVWARKRAAIEGKQVKRDITFMLTSTVRLGKNSSLLPITSRIYPHQPQPIYPFEEVHQVKPQPSVTSPPQLLSQSCMQDYNR